MVLNTCQVPCKPRSLGNIRFIGEGFFGGIPILVNTSGSNYPILWVVFNMNFGAFPILEATILAALTGPVTR